jgi:hypothetical protein
MNNKAKFFFVILIIAGLFSCSSLSQKEIQNIKGQNFYFQKINYTDRYTEKETIYEIFHKFPFEKITKLIDNKYGIVSDTSEFANFKSSNDDSKIKIKGLYVLTLAYTWESPSKNDNHIEFDVTVKKHGENEVVKSLDEIKFCSFLVTKEKKSTISDITVFTNDIFAIFPDIAKSLGYERLNKNSEIYVNTKDKSQVDLSVAYTGIKTDKSAEDSKLPGSR